MTSSMSRQVTLLLLSAPVADILLEPSADTSLRRSKWSRHRNCGRGSMPLYQHLLSIQENAGGSRNTEYAAVLTKYAFVLRNLKRKPDAVGLSAQACASPRCSVC